MKPKPLITEQPEPTVAVVKQTDALPVTPTAQRQPTWRSRQLFAGHNELWIEHAGAVYRLRITQANKLILTK